MNNTPLLHRPWVRWLLVLGIWVLVGLVDAGQTYYASRAVGHPLSLWMTFSVSDWYVWAALTPLIVWQARSFPLEKARTPRIAFHALASLVSALIVIAVQLPILRALSCTIEPLSYGKLLERLLVYKLVTYVLIHWLILGITNVLVYYSKYRERELRASRLETELVQAQLQMLKMQIQPHFLFNTLHAISALVHKDADLADRMIARLGELLRITLDNAGTQEVPLRQELDFIRPYLEIEKARLGARLSVHFNIDPALLDAPVPNLILQPLVENAIRHGIAPRSQPGRIEIHARGQGGRLVLEVRDTGPGLPSEPNARLKEGVGVSNTRARLRHLYGDAQRFAMENSPEGGLLVSVQLPFQAGEPSAKTEESDSDAREDRELSLPVGFVP